MKIDRSAFTINEFCFRNHICRASYYNDRRRGQGPREMVIGGRVRITATAEADWQREREAERAAVNALQPESKSMIAPPACIALTGGDKIAGMRRPTSTIATLPPERLLDAEMAKAEAKREALRRGRPRKSR